MMRFEDPAKRLRAETLLDLCPYLGVGSAEPLFVSREASYRTAPSNFIPLKIARNKKEGIERILKPTRCYRSPEKQNQPQVVAR
jgi:hypothetical protein